MENKGIRNFKKENIGALFGLIMFICIGVLFSYLSKDVWFLVVILSISLLGYIMTVFWMIKGSERR